MNNAGLCTSLHDLSDEETAWMKPQDLGQKINSISQGLCPVITADGKYMFFIGQGDIFWVEAGFIEELRPKKK